VDDAHVPVATDLELRNLDQAALKNHAELLYRTLGPERVVLSPPNARADLLAWCHRVQRLHSRSELLKSVRPLERRSLASQSPWRAPWLDSIHARQQMTTEKDGTKTVRGLLGDEVQMDGKTQTTSALDQNTGERFVHSQTRSLSPVGGALRRSSYLDDPLWRREPNYRLCIGGTTDRHAGDPLVRSSVDNLTDPLLYRHRRWNDQFLSRTSSFCLDDPLLLRSRLLADSKLDADVAAWRSSVRML
jgi:CubicO group peptidase (beta-lactamase class C family)